MVASTRSPYPDHRPLPDPERRSHPVQISPTGTVVDLLMERLSATPQSPAIAWFPEAPGSPTPTPTPTPIPTPPPLTWLSWSELGEQIRQFAATLQAHRVQAGDRVVLISENRLEWIVSDLALLLCGAVNVPLHCQSTANQINQLIDHCQPRLVLVSDDQQLEKITPSLPDVPVLAFDTDRIEFRWPVGRESEWTRASVQPTDLISILYTSGTTGEPKGVMLSQQNVRANIASKLATLPLGEDDVRLMVLPLSHIFARVCDLYTWIAAGCQLVLSRGWDVIWQELQWVQPTYINAVPYFYEKCYRILQQRGELADPVALKNMLGGRTRVCNCGGAAIASHVFQYWLDHKVGFVAGYGLTETSPVLTSNRLGHAKLNSVGPAVPGVTIQLADDGEVLAKGDNVMAGYYRAPQATQQVFRDGWFCTGDIGELDQDGYLYITGRKKELIVTTGGKNIAPVPIEKALEATELIEQAVVFGDGRDYLVALIVPSGQASSSNALDLPGWLSVINTALVDFSKYEQIGRFAILDEPLSIDNELLTPKKSKRREKIFAKYQEWVESLYALPDFP